MWDEAEQMLTEAQTRLPQQPELLLGLGVAAAHVGKPPEVTDKYSYRLTLIPTPHYTFIYTQ